MQSGVNDWVKPHLGAWFRRFWHWPGVIALMDGLFLFAVWVLSPESAGRLSAFFLLASILGLAAGIAADMSRWQSDARVLAVMMDEPGADTTARAAERFFWQPEIARVCTAFFARYQQALQAEDAIARYRDYIEAWVHDMKTPLALFSLVMGNYREELSGQVAQRLSYIGHLLESGVQRVLYYSRLGASHPDYRFERFDLRDCVQEVLEDYQVLIEERGVQVSTCMDEAPVVSDHGVVAFMAGQLIGNAIKYSSREQGKVQVSISKDAECVVLDILNNGSGVSVEDRPFLFDKGFTGSQAARQRATGMGLYLVSGYAHRLNIGVSLDEAIPWPSGFGISLTFPL